MLILQCKYNACEKMLFKHYFLRITITRTLITKVKICMPMCVCVCVWTYIYIYIYILQDRRYVEYIEKNVARVRDIELLTGLRFHPEIAEAERLRLSVFLSEALWDRMGWMDLRASGDEECPTLGGTHNCPAGYVYFIGQIMSASSSSSSSSILSSSLFSIYS